MVSTNQVYDGFIVKAIRVERVNEIVWKFPDGNVLIKVVLRFNVCAFVFIGWFFAVYLKQRINECADSILISHGLSESGKDN